MSDHGEFLDNEWFVVRHSGELPEVALHSSLHFLTTDQEGPRLLLEDHQLRRLQEAAADRYRDIILRDLTAENRDASIYRGVKRAIINYQRYQRFCRRQGLDGSSAFIGEVSAAFLTLLHQEVADVAGGRRDASINCSYQELTSFAGELGIATTALPEGLAAICPGLPPTGEISIV